METLALAAISIFFDDRFTLTGEALRVLESEKARHVVASLRDGLMAADAGAGFYAKVTRAVREKTGLRGKDLFMPIRSALTGRTRGPELDKIFSLLGKESLLKRVEKALKAIRA